MTKSTQASVELLFRVWMKALGTFLGPRAQRAGFLQGKIDLALEAIDSLKQLPKQHALLSLRGSLQFLLRHLLRQLEGTLCLSKRTRTSRPCSTVDCR